MDGRWSCKLLSRTEENGQPVWPITIDQLKLNAQIEHDDDDCRLEMPTDRNFGIIPAAVQAVEELARVAFITQTRRWSCDYGLPSSSQPIELPFPPLQTVESVKYLDQDYNQQTVLASTYRVATNGHPGRVSLRSGLSWPNPVSDIEAIQIDYTCGYGDTPQDVPMLWKQPILALATYWYEHPQAFDSLAMDESFNRQLSHMIDFAGRSVRYV